MQKFLITGVIVLALTAPAFAQGMSGPSQPAGGMSGPSQSGSGMASGGMAHDGMAMGKKKPKKPKHDAMGGAMSAPAQSGGTTGGMSGPNH